MKLCRQTLPVIPAKAGISTRTLHAQREVGDSRFRGNDGNPRRRKNNRGAALFLAVGLLAVVASLSAVFYAAIHRQLATHHHDEARIEALHIAEGGLNYAIAKLAHDAAYSGSAGPLGLGRYEVTVDETDGAFTVTSTGWPTQIPNDERAVTIEATVERDGGAISVLRWRRVPRGET